MASLTSERELHYIFHRKLAQFGLAVDRMETAVLAEVFAENIHGIYSGTSECAPPVSTGAHEKIVITQTCTNAQQSGMISGNNNSQGVPEPCSH